MLKTYEGFKDFFNKLSYPRTNHWFEDYQIEDLKKFSFSEDKSSENTFVYNIQYIDKIKQIKINRIANQLPELHGFITKYKVTLVYYNNKYKYEYFKDFESALEYIDIYIPPEEVNAKKYNL